MFYHPRSGEPLPKHVSTDNVPLFRFHRWRASLRVLVYDPGGIGAPHQDRSFSVARRQTATLVRRMSKNAAAVWLIAPVATQARIRTSRVRVNHNLAARLGAGAENTK